MRICIPTATKDGLKAAVYGHFGSAPFFTLCDSKTLECKTIDNGNLAHVHGMCNPLKAVGESKPDAVAVGGIGMGALRGLNAAGIKEADASAACGGHGAHGCHRAGGGAE